MRLSVWDDQSVSDEAALYSSEKEPQVDERKGGGGVAEWGPWLKNLGTWHLTTLTSKGMSEHVW